MEDFIFEKALPVIAIPIAATILYLVFVWMPFHVANESACLSKGYPETRTTISLDAYCLNIDGVVTGKVVKL